MKKIIIVGNKGSAAIESYFNDDIPQTKHDKIN